MSKDVTTMRGTEPDEEAEAERESVLSDGYIIDYITGEKHLKDTILATWYICSKIDNLFSHHPPIFFVMLYSTKEEEGLSLVHERKTLFREKRTRTYSISSGE